VSWNKNLQQGTVQALYVGDETLATFDGAKLNRTFNLVERPAISAILNQQRPVFFQLSSRWLDEAERKDMVQTGSLSRLLVPLVVKSETIGWAELWETRHERLFTPDEIRLIRMLANQAAVNLENARYMKQTRQTLEETTALYEVARALATTQDTQTIMSTVLKEYLRVLELEQGSVIIFDFDTKVGVVKVNIKDEPADTHPWPDPGQSGSQRGLEGRQISLTNNPLYARLMQSRQPVVVEDTRESWLAPPDSVGDAVIGGGWVGSTAQSMLVIPIQIRGEIIGAIVAEATGQGRAFENWAISLGQAMADQLSIALQNVRLYEAEYERRQQAETLRQVSFAVGSSLNLNEVLERILDQLGRVIKYDSAAIHLIEGNRRRIIAGRGFPHPGQVIGLSFPVTLDMNEPGSVAIHTRQPLVIGNIQELYDIFKETPHNHIRSWMGIPLIARDQVIGLISIDRTEPNAYNEGDVNLALAFANQVAIALENARLYEIEVRQLERELEIAQGIQESLLPQVTPDVPGLEICGRIIPARHIGGDFFHFFLLEENRFGVAVGDVSGKGIPAALYMAVAMTAIDAQIGETQGPGELLDRLQSTLYQRLSENKMNVALQVATFASPPANPTDPTPDGPSQKMMTLASAGMIAPILATAGGCRLLPVSGLPIGTAMPDLTYDDKELLLHPSTAIIFTSDGIVEARNQTGELFGFERLERTVNEVIHSQRAETIADHIILAAEKFMGKAEPSDDMTVVVVIAKPDQPNPYRYRGK
jgi:sigma-B regulation protein RsbU (phosphoserine phosphatase)